MKNDFRIRNINSFLGIVFLHVLAKALDDRIDCVLFLDDFDDSLVVNEQINDDVSDLRLLGCLQRKLTDVAGIVV